MKGWSSMLGNKNTKESFWTTKHQLGKLITRLVSCDQQAYIIPNRTFLVQLRAAPMEKTDTVSLAQKIIYRNYLPQWRISLSNKYFLFLSPKSIFFLQWQASADPLKTGDFSTMVILWFLDVLGEEKTWFLPHETVSSIFSLFLR